MATVAPATRAATPARTRVSRWSQIALQHTTALKPQSLHHALARAVAKH